MNAAQRAQRDQLQAAARDARGLIAEAAHAAGGAPEWAAPPAWLQAHVDRISLGALTGAVRTCPHVSASPSVAWPAAWRPGEVWCAACFQTAMLAVRGTAEDDTCDSCRRYARPIYSSVCAVGPLLVACGLCAGCRADVRSVAA